MSIDWSDGDVVDFLNALLENAPEWFDEDADQSSIALGYVRWLEGQLFEATGQPTATWPQL